MIRRAVKILSACAAVCLPAVLAACSGGSAGVNNPEGPAVGQPLPLLQTYDAAEGPRVTGLVETEQALPPLPTGRAGSGLTETSLDGAQSFDRSSSALPADPVLQLNSASGALSWGIWELPATDELRYLDVQLAVPAGQQAWLALSDYSSGRWEISGPLVGERVVSLDPAKHSSSGGSFYAAVLAYNGAHVTVQKLSLVAFHSNAAPSAALQASISSGTAPLSVSFDAGASSDPDNNIARYLWDFDGDGVAEGSSSGAQVTHVYSSGGSFGARVTVEDLDGARSTSSPAAISVNSPPVAKLEIPAAEVNQNDMLSLQGGGSSDPDGSIAKYEWDSDGNGSFDTDSGSSKSINITALRAGRLSLKLRVTDNSGAMTVASGQLYVRGFNQANVDGQDFAGIHTQVLAVNGRPAVCYEAGPNASLWYCRANDSEGTAWATPVELDPGLNTGEYNSMILVNGRPAISYWDQGIGALKYVRASDGNGDAWGAPKVLEQDQPNDSTGAYGSMAIVNGRPAIAYHNNFGENHYLRADDANGDSWPANYVILDNGPGDTGYYNSLAVVGGFPAVAYIDLNQGNLMYIRATDSNGSAWGSEKILDDVNTCASPSLAVLQSKPAIAYYRTNGQDLMFTLSLSDDGAGSWEAPLPLDTTGATGKYPNLRVIGGLPVIAFNRSGGGEVYYLRATRPDARGWGSPVLVDSGLDDFSGAYLALGELNGSPIFSYQDYISGNQSCVGFAIGY